MRAAIMIQEIEERQHSQEARAALEGAADIFVVQLAESTRVFREATSLSDQIGHLPAGTEVRVLQYKSGLYRAVLEIQLDGSPSWPWTTALSHS